MSDKQNPPASGATVVARSPPSATPPPIPAASAAGPAAAGPAAVGPAAVGPAAAGPAAPSPSAPDPLVGEILQHRYKVLERLGEGGMGTVYLAEHTTIRKRLALKVLAAEYAHKQDLVDRFLQEARAASMIDQENVVEITDFGSTPNGSVFFVMEFLQGEDLSHTVKREGGLPWARVKSIMLQICHALEAAHERGIIHRDMKPENCYRIKRGKNQDFIKVLDFGIAKVTSDEGEGKGLTRTGMIFGTPEYMSPEQAKGERPDHRVDVYATGVILYELLTGQVPFTADTFMGILTKHMFEAPPAPTAVNPTADVPPEVEAIILKALQKDREYRFSDMNDMAAAIEAVGTGTAAVSVVSETVSRPLDGRTEFTGGGTYPPAGANTFSPATGQGRSSKGLIIGGIVGVVAVAGVLGVVLGAEEPPPEATPAVVEPLAAPEPVLEPTPAPEPEPAPKILAPEVQKVVFKISTPGIDAQILDAADEGMYGMSNSSEGVEVEKSKEPLKLILRADGYEDMHFSIVPKADKRFTKKLKKKKLRPKKPRPKPPSAKPGTKKPSATTAVKPATPKKPPRKPKKGAGSPDLKDPFGGGG